MSAELFGKIDVISASLVLLNKGYYVTTDVDGVEYLFLDKVYFRTVNNYGESGKSLTDLMFEISSSSSSNKNSIIERFSLLEPDIQAASESIFDLCSICEKNTSFMISKSDETIYNLVVYDYESMESIGSDDEGIDIGPYSEIQFSTPAMRVMGSRIEKIDTVIFDKLGEKYCFGYGISIEGNLISPQFRDSISEPSLTQ